MEIFHVASECDPLAKTGGLADVLGALPAALARAGHQVTVVLPGYRTALEKAKETTPFGPPIDVQGPLHGYRLEPVSFEHGGVRTVLLRCDELFDRSNLYGSGGRDYSDNAIRFIAFARAAASLALYRAHRPHILHAHDWQAALAVALVATARPRPREPKTVLTIHNLAYQGVFDTRVFPYTGLPAEASTRSRRRSTTGVSDFSRPGSSTRTRSRPSARPTRTRSRLTSWGEGSTECCEPAAPGCAGSSTGSTPRRGTRRPTWLSRRPSRAPISRGAPRSSKLSSPSSTSTPIRRRRS